VTPDDFFKKAGFEQFDDSSDRDQELLRMTTLLAEFFSRQGDIHSHQKSWIARLFRIEPSLRDVIDELDEHLHEDRDQRKFSFGEPFKAAVQTRGTQLWEVTLPERNDALILDLCVSMAEGRPIHKTNLHWERFGYGL